MCAVTMLVDWSVNTFEKPVDSEVWYYVSPIAYTEQIANPVMVTAATGDVLVPIEQVSAKHVVPCDPEDFPEGYKRDFETLTPVEQARVTLAERIPDEAWSVATMPLQEKSYEITLDHFLNKIEEEEGPDNQDRPWSKEKQWSLVVFEEGPPAPYASHTRYMWATSPDSFVDHYREAAPSPGILNAAKLTRLLERYAGIDDPNVTLGKENKSRTAAISRHSSNSMSPQVSSTTPPWDPATRNG